MSDLFDEFMRELQRRRAQAEGKTPGHSADGDEPVAGDDPGDDAPADASGDDAGGAIGARQAGRERR